MFQVKQPVLCPNNHVFCGVCMEVWLQRNQQCPACRVDINPQNPIQQIRGGLNHFDEEVDKLTTPQLRKARFELLYKEYEDEFERLSTDIQVLKTENETLKVQLKERKNNYHQSGDFTHPGNVDGGQILALTRKLLDSQKQCDRQKQDTNRYKQENDEIKDENVNLNRENERLRIEIASRSPHRYGRLTVATLEKKLEEYEKEIKQLNKALERSDQYIEDLEKQLEESRKTVKKNEEKGYKDYHINNSFNKVEVSKSKLFDECLSKSQNNERIDPTQFGLDLYKNSSQNIDDNYLNVPSASNNTSITSSSSNGKQLKSKLISNSPVKNRVPKKVQFNLKENDLIASSFDLEKPSPLTPTYIGKLSLSDEGKSWMETVNNSSAKKKLNFEDVGKINIKEDGLDDTGAIKLELDDLNISITPELSDCMKLLNRAEKNVHIGDSEASNISSTQTKPSFVPSELKSSKNNTSTGSYFNIPMMPGMTLNSVNYPDKTNLPYTNSTVTLSNSISTISHSLPFNSSTGHILPQTTCTNPDISRNIKLSASNTSVYQSGQYNKPVLSTAYYYDSQNYSAQGLTDMVNRGKTILRNLEYDTNSSTSLRKDTQPNSGILQTRLVKPMVSVNSIWYQDNQNDILNTLMTTKSTKKSTIPKINFDIPQSLIIASPNLSSEFRSEEARSADNGQISVKSNTAPTYSSVSKESQTINSSKPIQSLYYSSSNPSTSQEMTSSNHLYQTISTVSSLPNLKHIEKSIPSTYDKYTSEPSVSSSSFLSFTGNKETTSSFSYNNHPESHASVSHQSTSSLINGSSLSYTGNNDILHLDAPNGNYSYLSNTDLSSRASDSFLPEPKKRLFDNDSDFDVTMSPIKTSKHY